MGIHGSATCVMHFEEAEGYLIGAPHQGLRCMFTMMNGARLGVGLQGLGLGETAYQSAAAYARERRQGRALKGAAEPDVAADPIIVHPDVRRMLLNARALNEGARALAYWVALQLDISHRHPDATVREDADELVQLMTPIIKAFFTDTASRRPISRSRSMAARLYPRARHGAARARRAYLADLRGRERHPGARSGRPQAAPAGGPFPPALLPPGPRLRRGQPGRPGPRRHRGSGRQGAGKAPDGDADRRAAGLGDPEEAGAAASDYLRMFGLVAVGYMWCQMARLAADKANGDAFYESKLKTARFYVQKILPDTAGLFLKIMAGKSTVMAHDAEEF